MTDETEIQSEDELPHGNPNDADWDEPDATLSAQTPALTRPPDMAVDFAAITDAAQLIKRDIVRTPLIESPALNVMLGGRVLIKCETLQVTGSFKYRGASNRILRLSEDEQRAGVIAWSSGNHAQGIAAAARRLGIKATIIMPHDAPSVKISATRSYGAEIIFYHRQRENREEIGHKLAKESGAVLIPSYDDPYVIAGQGTCGLEIAEDCMARGISLDAALICCSGGGLAAGSAIAIKKIHPKALILTVEPQGYDDMARSLATGMVEDADVSQPSICDALLAAKPGVLTLPILRHLALGGIAVSDAEVMDAMRFAFNTLKLVVEPGGAVALAALVARRFPVEGKTVAITLSGGNVNPEFFGKVISGRL